MGKTYSLDQMSLFTAISREIAKQCPKMPADHRSNAIIKAANILVKSYGMSEEEFIEKYGKTGEGLING